MKKTMISMGLVALLAGAPVVGFCGFPSLGGLGSSLKGSGGGDLAGQQTSLVKSYTAGHRDVLSSQSKLMEALGLKDKAATAQATANALSDGSTTQELEDADKAVSDNTQAIQQALQANNPTLDAQAKQTYAQGLVLLAAGLVQYTGMKEGVANFSKGLAGPGAVQAATKLQIGAYIVKTLPNTVSTTSSTLHSAVSFAQSHGIEVPADATAAL